MVRPGAADLEVPASCYQLSLRPFPESLPAIEYEPGVQCAQVQDKGEISFGGKTVKVGQAFQAVQWGSKPL